MPDDDKQWDDNEFAREFDRQMAKKLLAYMDWTPEQQAAWARGEPLPPATPPAPVIASPAVAPAPPPTVTLPRWNKKWEKCIQDFIDRVWKDTGQRILRKNIDQVAGYANRRARERLEAGKGNPTSAEKYGRVLQMESSTFINQL